MFLGTYETKFSGKGRVILPKKLREGLDGNYLVLSKGFENCIWGFSYNDFEKQARVQLKVSITEEQARFQRRFLFSSSEPVEMDNQGRFIIPSTLLDFASVRVSAVIIGAGDHFEIWDKELWEKHIMDIGRQYGRLP